jgi:sortase B
LREINSECIAWLTIPGTTVDYPVMHTPNDPEKYLNRSFYGNYSVSGVPFLDADCTVYGTNMIIYGHDMNGGTMFAPLLNYMTKSYAQQHTTIQLETEQGEKIYTVYCAARVKSDDLFYNLKDAPNQESFDQKVKNLSQRALYTLGNQPEYGQKLLTLSTCTNTGQDDRVIVVAVQNK